MKKAIALVLFAAVIFALAACAKKGQRYEEPPTEIITFENGGREVYEVVTDQNGEAQTDAEGKKVYRLYDPPVTDKGGYLVTDAEGSTIKKSAATGVPVTVDVDSGSGVLDDETAAPVTDKNGQTVAQPTEAEGVTLNNDGSGGKKDNGKNKETTIPQLEHAMTAAYTGELSQGKANKLIQIMNGIENPFEEDLANDRFNEAKESVKVYISNIAQAQAQIKADPELYAFVTKSNLEYWNYYLTQMERKYGEFVSIYNAQKPGQKPSSSVYTSYVAFQDEYRKAIEVYYSIYDAAEPYAK